MHDLDNVNYDLWIDGNTTCGWDAKCTRVYKNDKKIIGLFPELHHKMCSNYEILLQKVF